MKKKVSIALSFAAITLLMPFMLNAQGHKGIPNLTGDQQAKISELHTKNMKEMQQLRNQLGENRAHYKTLMTTDKPDMDAINKNIDEFGKIRTDMMKKNAAHQQAIRALLNDEQRLYFDSHPAGRGKMGRGPGGMPHHESMGGGKGFGGNAPGPFCPMNSTGK